MANWQQELLAAEEKELQQRQGLNQPFGLFVNSVASDSETMNVGYYGTTRNVHLPHPFVSSGSWIRAMPEQGAHYVGAFRADESPPQALNTYQRETFGRTDSYRKGQGIYRPMYPGELELSSLGLGQVFLPRRSRMEARGGTIQRWADQDRLTSGDRGPLHVKQFLQYKSDKLGDEHRIGIVTRPSNTWDVFYPKVRDKYAAEEYLQLMNPANSAPQVLFKLQRGHVLNSQGQQIRQQATQIPLRYKASYYANGDTSTEIEIDEKGNYYSRLADEAVEGYELVVPTGNFKKTVGKDEFVTIRGNRQDVVSNSVMHTVGVNYTKKVRKNIRIESEDGGSILTFISTAGQEQVVLTTKSGHKFLLDDTSGAPTIRLLHQSGSFLTFNPTEVELKNQAAEIHVLPSGKFRIQNQSEELLDLFDQTLQAILSALTNTMLGPQPFINLSTFASIKSKLATLKG